jgi:single-strand DNA-binding protein
MINSIILLGRLTAAPELRTTSSGTPVAAFTVAVERRYQQKGEDRVTDFIPVVAWRQGAEFAAKHFGKGSFIAVEGTLQTRRYEDKNGNPRTAFEVIADRISFTGDKSAPAQTTAPAPATPAAPAQEKMDLHYADVYTDDGDLPF